ncbi:hypothetical protein BH09BAC4_BH09BAC4_12390 [soil metagenome]
MTTLAPLPISPVHTTDSAVYSPATHRITLFSQNRSIVIASEDIVWLEGSGNYTFIHTRDKRRYLMAKTLKSFEMELSNAPFTRIHKSHVVNLAYVKRIAFGMNAFIELAGGKTLTIARRRLTPTRTQYNQHQKVMAN